MRLTCARYPGRLEWTGTSIARALAGLGEPINASKPLRMHGPFPLYVADAKQYARGATRKAIEQTGWRALISVEDRAVACVNLACPDHREPSIHVRGEEAAQALQRAIETGLEWLEKNGGSAELRFLSFSSLFLTAVWLHGRTSCFVLTRVDTRRSVNPEVLTRTELISLVARARNARSKRVLSGRATGHRDGAAAG